MDKKSIIITIILFVICFPVGIGYFIYKLCNKGIKKDVADMQQKMFDEHKQEKEVFDKMVFDLCANLGTPDKVIMIGWCRDALIVFDKEKKFILGKKEYDYTDLLDYNIVEKRINLDGTETVKTKTNLGSVVGRSIAGGLIAGPAGALIGGTTASKTSTVARNSNEDVWYEVNLKLRDLNTTTRKIEAYTEDDAAELDGVFSYITSNKLT